MWAGSAVSHYSRRSRTYLNRISPIMFSLIQQSSWAGGQSPATSVVTLRFMITRCNNEGNSISKLQIVIEKNRMEIMTYKQHLFFNIISIQI